MEPRTIRDLLATAGDRRSQAREEVARQSETIRSLAPVALEAGLTKTEIAQLAQISRPALDDMLRG